MSSTSNHLEGRLIHLVRASDPVMALLMTVRKLNLTSWCIGAGVIRSLVWDHLHGFNTPPVYADVDVAYFDSTATEEQEAE